MEAEERAQAEKEERIASSEEFMKAAELRSRTLRIGMPVGTTGTKRSEMPLARKAAVAKYMESLLSACADEKEMLQSAKREFGLPLNLLKQIWKQRHSYCTTSKKYRLSLNPGKYSGSKGVKKDALKRCYTGIRLRGAGRRSDFPEVLESVKAWFNSSRSHGLTVLPRHLLTQYQLKLTESVARLESELAVCNDKSERAKLDLRIQSGKKLLKNSESKAGGKNRLRHLMFLLEAKALKPDLTTKLSPAEEQIRAHLTWQAFDYMLWKACFAPVSALENLVCQPQQFRDSVKKLALVFSDQIPLWIKMGSEKEVFAKWESAPVPQSELRELLQLHYQQSLESGERGLKKAVVSLEESAEGKESGGTGQREKRSLREDSVDRYRVTYEARQAVLNYCSDGSQPVEGVVLPGLLVVHGTHCRLSNITESGCWKESERFYFNGKLTERKAGQSAGKLMIGWRRARSLCPSLFAQLSVMSQPSANVDSIIYNWSTLELAQQFPLALHQRDCFSAAWSPSASESLFLCGHLQVFISPKMTASLQLTDTDFGRSFKALCRSEMDSLRSAGQMELLKAGCREPWKASVLDFAKSVVTAQSEMQQRNLKSDWVLAGLRRNGILAYQPDWESGQLLPVADEKLKGMRMGSARLRLQVDWLKSRYEWVSAEKVPLEPDYSLIAGAKAVSDLLEWSYHNPSEASESGSRSEESAALMEVSELPEELQLPCIESGVLVLSLDL